MRKEIVIIFRHFVLYIVLIGIACAVYLSIKCPPELARAGGGIGAGWWAFRYMMYSINKRY